MSWEILTHMGGPRQFFGEGEKFDAYDVKNKIDTYETDIFYSTKNRRITICVNFQKTGGTL
ncbi:MAG TPA: hypothetical protein PLI57_04055 [Spirochaetota bacterium]|nr:hypothetical protein [Spirochaetota bacterium]